MRHFVMDAVIHHRVTAFKNINKQRIFYKAFSMLNTLLQYYTNMFYIIVKIKVK